MTAQSISTYYKWASLVTMALSLLGPMTLTEGTIGEKLWIGLLMNGQFHLAYQFISRVIFGMYMQIPTDNLQKKQLAQKILIGASLFIMIMPILPLIGVVKSAIIDHQYDRLMVTMTLVAFFLGGYSLNIKLRGR
jgi:hypothetical protein